MLKIMQVWRRLRGFLRSLLMYYWPPGQGRRMDRFYGKLVKPGQLCFDIGAHAGNRSLCFARLGARAIAVEPQPDFAAFLRCLFAFKPAITLETSAIGDAPGVIELQISTLTPTVTSASAEFVTQTPEIGSFSTVAWDRKVQVQALTLDQLIERHGMPDFIKLDIEGMELAALRGLSQAPALLSFEFLAARPADSLACLARLNELGSFEFNISRGENLVMEWQDWQGLQPLEQWISSHAGQDFSGDIYARLVSAPPRDV